MERGVAPMERGVPPMERGIVPNCTRATRMRRTFNIDRTRCVDCGMYTRDEYYMVRKAVWEESGMERYGGMLCIGCLENRLGRMLNSEDFTDAPINHCPGSARLMSRRG
jgi:hypothetical protein